MISVEEDAAEAEAEDNEQRERRVTTVDVLVILLAPVGRPEVVQMDKVSIETQIVLPMEAIREVIRSREWIMQVLETLRVPVSLANVCYRVVRRLSSAPYVGNGVIIIAQVT